MRRPLVLAHRGASAEAPENTLAAFRRALELGADGVELDVRRTADGVLVVHHDPERAGVALAEQTHAALRAGASADEAPPSLADALQVLAGRLLLDVELKEPGYERDVVALLLQHAPASAFVVSSFDRACLAALRGVEPRLRVGVLVEEAGAHDPLAEAAALGGDVLIAEDPLVDGLAEAAAAAGLPLWSWTVDDPARLRALCQRGGVEAIITDDVALALRQRG